MCMRTIHKILHIQMAHVIHGFGIQTCGASWPEPREAALPLPLEALWKGDFRGAFFWQSHKWHLYAFERHSEDRESWGMVFLNPQNAAYKHHISFARKHEVTFSFNKSNSVASRNHRQTCIAFAGLRRASGSDWSPAPVGLAKWGTPKNHTVQHLQFSLRAGVTGRNTGTNAHR